MRRALAAFALIAALGCASDEKGGRELDPRGTIREVFATRIRGDGTVVDDAPVTSVTAQGIEWGDHRRLLWADVDDVESQVDQEKPAHPETLYVYLKRASPSVETAQPERPPLSGAEVVRCYVLLRDRPPGSRAQLVRALRHLGASAGPPTPAHAEPAKPAPSTEERLARLKELHDKGLITDDVYREEQRRILAQDR